MDLIRNWIEFVLHLNLHLADWFNAYGDWAYGLLFVIIFCETGLVLTPFLPGDSLLFAAGSLLAATHLNIHLLVLILILAALCGDNVNYWFGRWLGPKVFRQDSRWLNVKYLYKTQAFYECYGAKTIIIARFLPVIRTFVPFVGGIGKMHYGRFLCFSLIGAILWVAGLLYLSYRFGQIPFVQRNFSTVILFIIVLSLLPALKAVYNGYRQKRINRS